MQSSSCLLASARSSVGHGRTIIEMETSTVLYKNKEKSREVITFYKPKPRGSREGEGGRKRGREKVEGFGRENGK